MICPRCKASNRDGAAFCDSCGWALGPQPASADESPVDDRPTLLDSGGLTGFMAVDWLLRFVAVGIVGFLAGLWTLANGYFGYSAFFFLLFLVGIAGSWFMLRAK